MRPTPQPVGPGQESVWDYPRPPRLEPVTRRITVTFADVCIVDTAGAYRVLETSHPPTYYVPAGDIVPGALMPAEGQSFCEWKGRAIYFDVTAGGRVASRAAWAYPHPTKPFAAIKDYVAFYCAAMDRCTVGDLVALPQPGGFYGGWVTSDLVGPFKGIPGSGGW